MFLKKNFILQILFVGTFRINGSLSWFYCCSRQGNAALLLQKNIHKKNSITTFCQHLPSNLSRSPTSCRAVSNCSKKRQTLCLNRSYLLLASKNDNDQEESVNGDTSSDDVQQIRSTQKSLYDLGLGRNKPLRVNGNSSIRYGSGIQAAEYWKAPEPVVKPIGDKSALFNDNRSRNLNSDDPASKKTKSLIRPRRTRRMVA